MIFTDPTMAPLVAILRGVTPSEILQVGEKLIQAEFKFIEVPLNSPDPFTSIRMLCEEFGDDIVCGAGTVLSPENVKKVHDAGGRIVLAPNTDIMVIKKAIQPGIQFVPGISSPSEAFSAIKSGARTLKLFPASTFGPNYVKAISAVLPDNTELLAVGGINETSFATWIEAGIQAFGIGSHLYRPGYTGEEVYTSAKRIMSAFQNAKSG